MKDPKEPGRMKGEPGVDQGRSEGTSGGNKEGPGGDQGELLETIKDQGEPGDQVLTRKKSKRDQEGSGEQKRNLTELRK